MKSAISNKILFEILFTLFFLFLLLIMYLTWERTRDPLTAINNVDLDAQLIEIKTVFDSTLMGRRFYSDVQILSIETDTIKAIISFPLDYKNKSFPVVTILGGLRIARQNFSFIRDPGENIIVIFIYPYQAEQWGNGFIISEIPRVRKAILKTPAQIVELNNWIQKQTWTDTSRISVLGYSFGAFFLPAVEQVASLNSVKTGPSIMSYGGADFELLLKKNLKVKPKWFRPAVAWFGATLIYAVDPIHHASNMKGSLYLINGLRDEQIPRASWQLLHQMMPESAKIDLLDEGHMHPRKPQLTQKLVDMSRAWLKEQGILN